jgi:hypothetical protein
MQEVLFICFNKEIFAFYIFFILSLSQLSNQIARL